MGHNPRDRFYLQPVEESRSLPAVIPLKPVRVIRREENRLLSLVRRVQSSPVVRWGIPVLAFAAGALLSRQNRGRGKIFSPSRPRCEDAIEEPFEVGLVVTSVPYPRWISWWYVIRRNG